MTDIKARVRTGPAPTGSRWASSSTTGTSTRTTSSRAASSRRRSTAARSRPPTGTACSRRKTTGRRSGARPARRPRPRRRQRRRRPLTANKRMKPCRKCGQDKPLTDFYASAGMRDGHMNTCKVCAVETSRAWAQSNPERSRELGRGGYRRRRAARLAEMDRRANSAMKRSRQSAARMPGSARESACDRAGSPPPRESPGTPRPHVCALRNRDPGHSKQQGDDLLDEVQGRSERAAADAQQVPIAVALRSEGRSARKAAV
jgi:hypothetical protein